MDLSPQPITLEVCVDSLASAKLAAENGAQRVELNTALELGGLTPSIGLVEQTIAELEPLGCRVIAMARPRPGGFAYKATEQAVMQSDIDRMLSAGIDGVALGVLTAEGAIDIASIQSLIQPVLDAGKEAVYHRAFDLTPDPLEALDALIELGLHRVLTSGQEPTAIQGAATIRKLIERASGRIEILPGSGITPNNVTQLVRETGCDQVHASLRQVVKDTSGACNPAIQFNSEPIRDGAYYQADGEKVIAMMGALKSAFSG